MGKTCRTLLTALLLITALTNNAKASDAEVSQMWQAFKQLCIQWEGNRIELNNQQAGSNWKATGVDQLHLLGLLDPAIPLEYMSDKTTFSYMSAGRKLSLIRTGFSPSMTKSVLKNVSHGCWISGSLSNEHANQLYWIISNDPITKRTDGRLVSHPDS